MLTPNPSKYEIVVNRIGHKDYELVTYADTIEDAKAWLELVRKNKEMAFEQDPNSALSKHYAMLEYKVIEVK